MVRASASFENHLRRCQFGEERFDLSPPNLAPQYRALLVIDPVDRKNMLGRVDRNAFKFHWAALSLGWLIDPILAHSMPLGRPPQHNHFQRRRHHLSAVEYRAARDTAFATWRSVTGTAAVA
jgi:hypothetical protein